MDRFLIVNRFDNSILASSISADDNFKILAKELIAYGLDEEYVVVYELDGKEVETSELTDWYNE